MNKSMTLSQHDKKALLFGLIAVVIIGAGGFIFNIKIAQKPISVIQQTPSFQELLQKVGVERVGQPVEGFDAFILKKAFPGLVDSDFDEVETLEGKYELVDGNLQYTRGAYLSVTSAGQTVSGEGYDTLLKNISNRLGIAKEDAVLIEARISTIVIDEFERKVFEEEVEINNNFREQNINDNEKFGICTPPKVFGCSPVATGANFVVDPDAPPDPGVCGCIPQCSVGLTMIASYTDEIWPDGSASWTEGTAMGVFHCSKTLPPSSAPIVE